MLAEELGTARTPPELQLRGLLAAFLGLQQRWDAAWATCERRGWVATVAGRRFSFSPASLKDVKVRCLCTLPWAAWSLPRSASTCLSACRPFMVSAGVQRSLYAYVDQASSIFHLARRGGTAASERHSQRWCRARRRRQ